MTKLTRAAFKAIKNTRFTTNGVGAITGATSNAHEEDTADSVVFLDSDVSTNSDFTVDGTKLTDRATIKALFDTGSGGVTYWQNVPGTPTRTGNYTFTITDTANANLYNLKFGRKTVLKWTDAGNTKLAMVHSATYSTDVVTVTIIGDILNTGFTNMQFAIEKADKVTFAIAGTIAATTNLSRKFKADCSLKVFGADALHGTAGTTNSTVYDLNKNGTTMFTTKVSIASAATVGNGFTANDGTTLALNDIVDMDCDSVSTTAPVDAYVDLFIFPLNNIYL
jgi:hypothetical protein